VSIEIDLKQAVVKLSNPTEEIRMLGEQGQQMRITKCRQDRQGRVFITVELGNRARARSTKTTRKKSVKRKNTKHNVTKSRPQSRSKTTKSKKTGFNKLLGEIL
jgi:hypothetical protein